MSIQEAADALREQLQNASWLTAVGVGTYRNAPCIYVYVNSLKDAEVGFLKNGWRGYPVEVRRMGTIRSGSRVAE
jgi:hypothetical protein